ncbi:unnamed protein product, partial [Rotaria sp. Silwood1]
MRPTDG